MAIESRVATLVPALVRIMFMRVTPEVPGT